MSKLAVVTGATKGIGREIVKIFARGGFDVAACARNTSGLEQLKQSIKQDYPSIRIWTRSVDMSKKNAVIEFGEWVLSEAGVPEVVVNNAGIFFPGTILEEDDQALETMIDTNLYSAYHLTRRLVPAMVKKGRGHVFNMCSTASIKAYPNGGSYCISKFALLGMSKVLREELKETGLRVTSIMPGPTYTASWEGAEIPEDRFIKASDIGQAVWDVYNLSAHTVVEELVLRPQLGDLP